MSDRQKRPPQRELAEAAQLIAEIDVCRERGDLLQWGIERLDIGQVIGTCTLADINPRQGVILLWLARLMREETDQ